MIIDRENYRFSEEEMNLIKKVEENGKIYYIIPKKRINRKIITKDEIIRLIKEGKKLEEVLLYFGCSFTFLKKYLVEFFNETAYGCVKRTVLKN